MKFLIDMAFPIIQKEIQIIREEPNTGLLAISKRIAEKLKQNKTKLYHLP